MEKALELKMLYQPLSKAQEDKYRSFKQRRDGIVEVRPTDTLESGEIIRETVQIPQVTTNASKFNTMNLQQELAKSMQQIMDATEKETVTDTMDNIKRIVEEIPYLQLSQEAEAEEQMEERYGHIETDEEIDGSLQDEFSGTVRRGIRRTVKSGDAGACGVGEEITGQMNIQDVLEEWERTRRAAEAALQDAEQRKLESAKAKALARAEDIMDRLATVIPQLDAGMSPKDLLEQEYLGKAAAMDSAEIAGMVTKHHPKEEAGQLMADVNDILQQQIDELSRVNEGIDEFLTEGVLPDEQAASEETENEAAKEDILPDVTAVLEAELAEETKEDETFQNGGGPEEESDGEGEEIVLPEIQLEPEIMEAVGGDTKELPKISEPEFEDEPAEDMPITKLSTRQREIFTYFTPVTGMEEQLCQALTGAKKHLKEAKSCTAGNIIIRA